MSKTKSAHFVYAGLPLLLSAVYSFALEYEGILNLGQVPVEFSTRSLIEIMEKRYGVSGVLLEDLRDFTEIRNEIVHPAPLPTGTSDNRPDYLRRIKSRGLLTTTGDPNADYILLAQIASPKLFAWAVGVTKVLYAAIINSNPDKAQLFQPFLEDNFQALFG